MRRAIDPQKTYGHLKDKVQWALCDKCGWHWPEKILNFRDGRKVCPNHSTYRETTNMLTNRLSREGARFGRIKEPVPLYPSAPEMDRVVGVEVMFQGPAPYTTPLRDDSPMLLHPGGLENIEHAVIFGRNLSTSDSITLLTDLMGGGLLIANLVVGAIEPDTRRTRVDLDIHTVGPNPNGCYNLTYNGDIFRGLVLVRNYP